jgi:hypothetical protein
MWKVYVNMYMNMNVAISEYEAMDMNIYTKRPALSPDHTEPGWHRCVRPLDRMKKTKRGAKTNKQSTTHLLSIFPKNKSSVQS